MQHRVKSPRTLWCVLVRKVLICHCASCHPRCAPQWDKSYSLNDSIRFWWSDIFCQISSAEKTSALGAIHPSVWSTLFWRLGVGPGLCTKFQHFSTVSLMSTVVHRKRTRFRVLVRKELELEDTVNIFEVTWTLFFIFIFKRNVLKFQEYSNFHSFQS